MFKKDRGPVVKETKDDLEIVTETLVVILQLNPGRVPNHRYRYQKQLSLPLSEP
jgi:hypothetical protein